MITAITIRVYGILINDKKQVLVSDERIVHNNREVTKFPGGGLEPGEGTIDCVIRECKEELGIRVAVQSHLYTTDFFQQSAFNDTDQIISIYYILQSLELLQIPVHNYNPVYPQKVGEHFRLVDWDFFTEDLLTLPIDKIAVRLLKEKY